jgi:hypothetical protein
MYFSRVRSDGLLAVVFVKGRHRVIWIRVVLKESRCVWSVTVLSVSLRQLYSTSGVLRLCSHVKNSMRMARLEPVSKVSRTASPRSGSARLALFWVCRQRPEMALLHRSVLISQTLQLYSTKMTKDGLLKSTSRHAKP